MLTNTTNVFNWGVFVLMAMILNSSCVSITGFQTGRTAGKDQMEMIGALTVGTTPDFQEIETDSGFIDFPTLSLPYFEGMFSYGITEYIDLSVKLNTFGNIGVGTKFQLYGDKTTFTAFSMGAEVATFGLGIGLWNVQIPAYFSVHPSEMFSWYVSPRYVYQFLAYTGAENGLTYMGGNTGILVGRQHKFGVDVGYFSVGNSNLDRGTIFQVGVAGVFKF